MARSRRRWPSPWRRARCGSRGRSSPSPSPASLGRAGAAAEKPVGLVHFAAAKALSREGDAVDFAAIHHEERFGDIGRAEVRAKSVETALRLLLRAAELD